MCFELKEEKKREPVALIFFCYVCVSNLRAFVYPIQFSFYIVFICSVIPFKMLSRLFNNS